MKNSVVKNQHFVPRAYLRYFSRKDKREFFIGVMDKSKTEPFMTNIKNVASYKYFYEVNSKPNNYWENYYNNIESTLPQVFNDIITSSSLCPNKTKILNENIKTELCKIICSQAFRTRKAREYFDKIGDNAISQVLESVEENLKEHLTDEHRTILNKYRDDSDFKHSVELEVINSEKIIKKGVYYLKQKVWVIYKNLNYKVCPFITSDHPVIYTNLLNKKFDFESNGIGNNATVILFPINRELLLVLYPKHILFEGIQIFANMVFHIKEDSFVLRVNRLQYLQSYKQAYFTFYYE